MPNNNDLEAIFSASGGISYDAVYSGKQYNLEADILKRLLNEHSRAPIRSLLDVACGTGAHMQYFANDTELTGVDIAEEQINLAQKRLPEAVFVCGDMRNFDIKKRFDAAICMFSSIAYVYPYNEFATAIRNMARHLKPGGVLEGSPMG